MKRRKIFVILLLFSILVTGCHSKVDTTYQKTNQTLNSTSIKENNKDNKILIVYYSSTGNTKEVAKIISKETDGDLFELSPVKPYSKKDLNYNDSDSRISKEYDNKKLRDIELKFNTVDQWDKYETIFVGYPLWWGNAAWPINSFIQLNNFKNKTVIPFCTSASSSIEVSRNYLKKQSNGGRWEKGKRFSSHFSNQDVKNWVKELKIDGKK